MNPLPSKQTRLLFGPEQSHRTLSELWEDFIKPHAMAHGEGMLVWEPISSKRRQLYRNAFHGPVLKDIADQVQVPVKRKGEWVMQRYSKAAFKEFFREMFLPMQAVEVVNADGEIVTVMQRQSTESMSDDEYSEFLIQVIAFSVTELGVHFSEESKTGEREQ